MSAARTSLFRFWPEGYEALLRLNELLKDSGLEPALLELVNMRASQINGCAYCIDMHSKDARAAGETEQRLYALSAWRDTPFFSDRERAALGLTEAVTLIAETHVPQAVLDEAGSVFSREELTKLVYVIIEINAWNRLAITVGRPEPGSYKAPAAVDARVEADVPTEGTAAEVSAVSGPFDAGEGPDRRARDRSPDELLDDVLPADPDPDSDSTAPIRVEDADLATA